MLWRFKCKAVYLAREVRVTLTKGSKDFAHAADPKANRANRNPGGQTSEKRLGLFIFLALLAVLEPRRRPIGSTLAWGVRPLIFTQNG